jgi:arylsulfatase
MNECKRGCCNVDGRIAGGALGVSRASLSADQSVPLALLSSGWPGEKLDTDMPGIVNIRQDPFERTPSIRGESMNDLGGGYMNDFYGREFWRFVSVQQTVADLAKTAIAFPPMQAPASFNLDEIKRKIDEVIKSHEGQ